MRYTLVSGKQTDKYIPTTAVVMAEIFKVAVALAMQLKVRLPHEFWTHKMLVGMNRSWVVD